MIERNLPVLVVIVPLLAGLLTALLLRGRKAWFAAMATVSAVLALTIALLIRTRSMAASGAGPWDYPMGDWKLPWGIGYRIDQLNAFVAMLVASVSTVITFFARRSVEKEIPEDRLHLFYALWQLCITGFLGITVTGDAFNVYVLLEIASLTSYTLIAMGKGSDRRALTASMNYVVLGTIGASFILLGIGYLYMVTGTLNMADIATRLGALFERWRGGDFAYRRTVITGFAFLMSGFGLKLALFPLHGWLPNAYTYAPSAVTALLASMATKVGAYLLIRFVYTILGVRFCFGDLPTGPILTACAALAVLVGSAAAIRQTNLKRLLAWSSIGQVGYIALGIAMVNENGMTGALVHMFNHALMKGGLFLAVGAMVYRLGAPDLSKLVGLGRRMPFTAAAFTAGGLSLVGVPLTAGFISKWYLVNGAIEKGQWLVAAAVVVGSLLAVVYVWRVVEILYSRASEADGPPVEEAPWSLMAPAWILIGVGIYFGIDASLTTDLAGRAARALLGAAP